MSHHLHFGPGFHHPHGARRATRGSVVLWIALALVAIVMVIASGVNALPGH